MTALTKDEIGRLLPHGESMCLLESVDSWDAVTIRCRTSTHRDQRNPLRFRGRLTAAAGLEYAAQAMGAHVGLVSARETHAHAIGLVGSVREVKFSADRLDLFDGPLTVNARRLIEGEQGYLYQFTIAHGAFTLVEGRASIFVKAAV